MLMLTKLTIILASILMVKGVTQCCENDTVVSKGKCSDGKILNMSSHCKAVVQFPEEEDDVIVDAAGNLIIGDEIIKPEEYCHATTKSQESFYFICLTEDMSSEGTTMPTILLVFQFISIIFFALTIVTYLMLPQMMDLQGICTIHSLVGYMIGYIVLISENISVSYDIIKCHVTAYFLYYGFLYAFFWLNLCCFNMWKTVVNPRKLRSVTNWKLIYHIYGIGFPLLLLLFVALVHHVDPPFLKSIRPGLTEGRCWFKSMKETMIYFYGPISILLLTNIGLFIWTSIELWHSTSTSGTSSALKYRTRLYISLFVVMGIQWIFEVISAVVDNLDRSLAWLWFITDSVNALTGVSIFIVLVVLRKRVIRGLANRSFLGSCIRFPSSWKHIQDSECDGVAGEDTIHVDTLIDN